MSGEQQTITAYCHYDQPDPVPMDKEIVTRCAHSGCKRILFKGVLGAGTSIEIQCATCKRYTNLQVVRQVLQVQTSTEEE